MIKDIEKILQTSVSNLKDLKEKGRFDDPAAEGHRQDLCKAIQIRFMSDSIMYSLNLSQLPAAKSEVVEVEPLTYCVHMFFRLISMFCTTLIGKTGLVIRGGMTLGSHYERDWEEGGSKCLFMFSKALVDAVELEKKEAKTARIVVAEDLMRYLKEKTSLDIHGFVFSDSIGKQCFNLYNIFNQLPAEHARKVLKDIKRAITMNIADSSSDPKALEKIQYFAEYHDKWVRNFYTDTDLLIYPSVS